jgi:succinyl-CoA synthetase beta subunit
MYSTEGGMNIEEVAPILLIKFSKNGFIQVVIWRLFKQEKLLFNLGLKGKHLRIVSNL